MKKKLYIMLGVLIALVPLGLLTDAPAWGEWDSSYFEKVLGFMPQGIEKIENSIHMKYILPDYSLPGANDVLGYYISAIVGAVLVFAIYYFIYLMVKRKKA
ncbi:PDGLE domain-containing protein [Nautilia profundicola]|uniref:PDGLE domain-containing protein n=1 Tax=Nautilia profundicola TaxID=244787 RepID=UPI0002F40ADA|nr:PDGLE domain-containing protein [Nautilia profundicola]